MTTPLCVYCGKYPGTTRDHVPPRGLFPPPRPSDLVTVPCCEKCRRPQGADDEYFKLILAIRDDIAGNPAAQQILGSVLRALERPEARGLANRIFESARPVEIRSPAGLFLRRGMIGNVEASPLDRVMLRTMHGLYWHETRERLPGSHLSMIYCIQLLDLARMDLEKLVGFRAAFHQAAQGRRRVFGDNVFLYCFQRFRDQPDATLWAFLIYGRVMFMGVTGPKRTANVSDGPAPDSV